MKQYKVLISGVYMFPTPEEAEVGKQFLEYLTKYIPTSMQVTINASLSDYYDAVFVLNMPHALLDVKVPKGNVFAIMQEPGFRGLHRFMYSGLSQYDTVFSPIVKSRNTIASPPYLGDCFCWKSLSKAFGTTECAPEKTKKLSIIASNLNDTFGHRRRLRFVKQLRTSDIELDVYGRGFNYIEHKEEGLEPYEFSIAIENSSKGYYFTEKLADCFFNYTIPFYYGCTNISKFFPSKSYIWIDIRKPQKAFTTIKESLATVSYKERLPFIKEARKLVLEKYNLSAVLREQQQRIAHNCKHNPARRYCIQQVQNTILSKLISRCDAIKKRYVSFL